MRNKTIDILVKRLKPVRQILAKGGLLCIVLFLIYADTKTGIYADIFGSSWDVLWWAFVLAATLWWTWRESKTQRLPVEVPEWAFLAAFLLMVANQYYVLLLSKQTTEMPNTLTIHTYSLPAILICGGLLGAAIYFSTKFLYRWNKEWKIRQSEHEAHRQTEEAHKTEKEKYEQEIKELNKFIKQSTYKSGETLYRKLLTNQSVYHLTNAKLLSLVKECQLHLDPELFLWLKRNQIEGLSARNVIICILIRLHKNADEIEQILGISHGAYRTSKSRINSCLQKKEKPDITLEEFLQGLSVKEEEEEEARRAE